ncbi:glutathione S-transferase family protein [Paracoccus pacificus]|uniref:Glutathione S-transferase family protein n=1 Tax=Paracoccus pacificus TaxID=1463598 RepID=A0ABW4R745_9RHOB
MTIRVFHSPASPFVRKVMVAAAERGVAVQPLPASALPTKRDPTVVRHNATGKIPCLLLDDDTPIFDSRVITAYLDSIGSKGPSIYPQDDRRFAVLTVEALADAICDAAVLLRYETFLRPAEMQWEPWVHGQQDKINSGLGDLEGRWFDTLSEGFTAAAIATACALGYLDFRLPDRDWRGGHPKLAKWFTAISARPSLQSTVPSA